MQSIRVSRRAGCSILFGVLAISLILVPAVWASSESILYNFNSVTGGTDGYYPYAPLIADKKGNLYGTTVNVGSGYGVVFELSQSGGSWTETVLHTFAGGTTDGAYPYGGLTMDASGNLYGVTYQGGLYSVGAVFQLKLSGGTWTETIIHDFAGYPKDGANPVNCTLVFDAKGNLYGTTYYGGSHNAGTAFIMTQSKGKWTEKPIHSFSGGGDGANPLGGITVGKNGYFFGTTEYGGPTFNAGTVYELFQARGVWVKKSVYAFLGGGGGTYPMAGVAMDASGNLFGTTYQGGTLNLGTVWELKAGKNNKFSQRVLYNFQGGKTDGANPYYAGVTLDPKGNIYGTAYAGNPSNYGIVYELKLSNGKYKEAVPHTFIGGATDGCLSRSEVILYKGGIYGTASGCGSHGGGVAFQIK